MSLCYNGPADATISTTINNFVYVGYANAADRANSANPTSPTVTLVGTGLSATPLGPDATLNCHLSGFLQDGHSITGDTINVQPAARMFTLVNAGP